MTDRRMKAWAVETDDHYAELFLILNEPRGEIDVYTRQPPALLGTRDVGLEAIAMFVAKRWDLVEAWLGGLIVELKATRETAE